MHILAKFHEEITTFDEIRGYLLFFQGSVQSFCESYSEKSYKIWSRGARHVHFSQNMFNMM